MTLLPSPHVTSLPLLGKCQLFLYNIKTVVGDGIKPFRDKIVLATKLHLNSAEGDTETVIRRHLEDSMKRLGTDYIDIYYSTASRRTIRLRK